MKEIKRLKVISNLVNEKNVVADIGADHGLLSKMLIEEGKAKKVIATDISKFSLQKTVELVKKFNIQDKVETIVGDGLKPLKNFQLDIAIIAGMGGYEIIKILSENPANVEKFILQPSKNQNDVELRKYLNNNNYYIEKDFVTLDRKRFYNTIVCYKSNQKQKLELKDIEFGLTNFDLKSEDFNLFLQDYLSRKEKVLKASPNKKEIEENVNMAKSILNDFYTNNK